MHSLVADDGVTREKVQNNPREGRKSLKEKESDEVEVTKQVCPGQEGKAQAHHNRNQRRSPKQTKRTGTSDGTTKRIKTDKTEGQTETVKREEE